MHIQRYNVILTGGTAMACARHVSPTRMAFARRCGSWSTVSSFVADTLRPTRVFTIRCHFNAGGGEVDGNLMPQYIIHMMHDCRLVRLKHTYIGTLEP